MLGLTINFQRAVCSPQVLTTIAEVRTPSITHLYAYKWKVFESWWSSKEKDPVVWPILPFLQECLDGSWVPSTLKLCIAAISAIHEVDRQSVGRNGLVIRFLYGTRWLNTPRPSTIPTWGLALVLKALACPPSSLPSRILYSTCKSVINCFVILLFYADSFWVTLNESLYRCCWIKNSCNRISPIRKWIVQCVLWTVSTGSLKRISSFTNWRESQRRWWFFQFKIKGNNVFY